MGTTLELVSSSTTGAADTFVSTLNVPVPAGAAANQIAVVSMEQWESSNPVVTPPAGFTEKINIASGSQKLKVYWKRLTGADAGNYTFSWTGGQWSIGHAALINGCVTSGDPIEDFDTAIAASGTDIPALSVTTTELDFLFHAVAHDTAGTKTPPTGYTEFQESNYLASNYKLASSVGTQSASGGLISVSTLSIAALLALKPEGGSAPSMGLSIADQARANMLTALVLTEPQKLSNTDLMKLVMDAGGLGLITVTNASPATHLIRYMMSLR